MFSSALSIKLNWPILTFLLRAGPVWLSDSSVILTSSSYYLSWWVSTLLVYWTLLLHISRTVKITLPTLKHSPPNSSNLLLSPANFRFLILILVFYLLKYYHVKYCFHHLKTIHLLLVSQNRFDYDFVVHLSQSKSCCCHSILMLSYLSYFLRLSSR